jgi:hypothetical protein
MLRSLLVGIGWCGLLGRRSQSLPAVPANAADLQLLPAVRRDWPETGHDFAAFGLDGDVADRWIVRDAAYWRRGPIQPFYSRVVISRAAYLWHHHYALRCTSDDCPIAIDVPANEGDVR